MGFWKRHKNKKDADKPAAPHYVVFEQAGLARINTYTPIPTPPDIVDTGYDPVGNPWFIARMIPGHQTLKDWQDKADRLASAWRVPAVTIELAGTNLVKATALINKFERTGMVRWRPEHPVDEIPGISVEDYLAHLTMGELAGAPQPWAQSFVASCSTIGGNPGSGKSSYVNGAIAHFILHPHIDVGFIDLKGGVEAEQWKPRLSVLTCDPAEAVVVLRWFKADLEARLDRMRDAGVRNAWEGLVHERDDQGRVLARTPFLGAAEHVKALIVDETAELFSAVTPEQRKLATEAAELLRSIVSRGRAAGYLVLFATQKPTVDSIPSAIRDLTKRRACFQVSGTAAAIATLSSAWSPGEHPSPLTIPLDTPGRAVVGDDTGRFVEVQMANVLEHQINDAVARTTPWRVPWPCQNTRPDPGRVQGEGAVVETGAGQDQDKDQNNNNVAHPSYSGHLPTVLTTSTPKHAVTTDPNPDCGRRRGELPSLNLFQPADQAKPVLTGHVNHNHNRLITPAQATHPLDQQHTTQTEKEPPPYAPKHEKTELTTPMTPEVPPGDGWDFPTPGKGILR